MRRGGPSGPGLPGHADFAGGQGRYGAPQALDSCSHGAGRALSRSEAAARITPRQCARELRHVWYDERATRSFCTEAPSAYKEIRTVLRAQRELVQMVRELRPVLCYKAPDRR